MGTDCVDRLNGDFAFAHLGRAQQPHDAGARPHGRAAALLHGTGGVLYFASEVKALLAVPGIDAEIDPIALDQIFTLWAPIAPRTPFKESTNCSRRICMIADGAAATLEPYWRSTIRDRDDTARTAQRGAMSPRNCAPF